MNDLFDFLSNRDRSLNNADGAKLYCKINESYIMIQKYSISSFLQAILQYKKQCLKSSDIKMQNVRYGLNEFAIDNI